jgi:hypothetical protein
MTGSEEKMARLARVIFVLGCKEPAPRIDLGFARIARTLGSIVPVTNK